MSQNYFTNTTQKVKEKHFIIEDRRKLESLVNANHILPKEKRMTRKEMAEIIGCSIASLYRELKRGEVILVDYEWREYSSYSADLAQEDYDLKATNKGPNLKIQDDHDFVEHVEKKILIEKWSPDAIIMDLRKNGNPFKTDICTRTLYYYIENDLFLNVALTDLPRRGEQKKYKKRKIQTQHKIPFGKNITERSKEAEDRLEAGHWEMDCVESGKKKGSACLLTLIDRKLRISLIFKLRSQSQKEVLRVLDSIEKEIGTKEFQKIFKSITVDNGSEFLDWIALETSIERTNNQPRTNIYYCHSYASYERGSNEQMHTLIRRFIPKGSRISAYSKKKINEVRKWINDYPRKLLDSFTSKQLALKENNPIYQQLFRLNI